MALAQLPWDRRFESWPQILRALFGKVAASTFHQSVCLFPEKQVEFQQFPDIAGHVEI